MVLIIILSLPPSKYLRHYTNQCNFFHYIHPNLLQMQVSEIVFRLHIITNYSELLMRYSDILPESDSNWDPILRVCFLGALLEMTVLSPIAAEPETCFIQEKVLYRGVRAEQERRKSQARIQS